MRALHSYDVIPHLPPGLERLRELANNLRWSWDGDTQALFARLDRGLWNDACRNPVKVLAEIRQDRLDAAARDQAFVGHYQRVCDGFDAAMERPSWYHEVRPDDHETQIAYFSMEYGITECLPIYSGGLGVLSGDHLKSASDLGLPLVAVGLMYQQGYFRQYLNPDGWQQELYPENDPATMPVELVTDDEGLPVTAVIPFPGRDVTVRVWRIQVGRVPLYLLDTHVDSNRREDQDITHRLYGVGHALRIKQEMILGIGGVKILRALGIQPTTFHMNEGHSAFLAIERIRAKIEEEGLDFDTARDATAAGNAFTTHTPVPAGIDRFGADLVEEYFGHLVPRLGISMERFLDLGRLAGEEQPADLSMAVLALRLSAHHNGVSKLHSQVSRRMWCDLWPEAPCEEVPIRGITNGVHAPTWISAEMTSLFDRYLGQRWRELPQDEGVWGHFDQIPTTELWRTHERRRERLVAFARGQLRSQIERRSGSPAELALADEVLDPEALTIGFARRFATYKRANLILADLERLHAMANDRERPLQIIFAGKAHPADDPGKKLIKEIVHVSRREEFRHRVVFLENYDMAIGRYLVQGVDVWLNTPRRPKEASGTSGMKATMNGALHVSTLDGWWAEAYRPDLGWSIGGGEEYADPEYGDRVEGSELFDMLANEIIPLFYDRGTDGLPRGWVEMMKRSMQLSCHRYNTARMVRQYAVEMYLPAHDETQAQAADDHARARALAGWRRRMIRDFPGVSVLSVDADGGGSLRVGDRQVVTCRVQLGQVAASDLMVEVYHGGVDSHGELIGADRMPMELAEQGEDGVAVYRTDLACRRSGRRGFSVRAYPFNDDLPHHLDTRLIVWG